MCSAGDAFGIKVVCLVKGTLHDLVEVLNWLFVVCLLSSRSNRNCRVPYMTLCRFRVFDRDLFIFSFSGRRRGYDLVCMTLWSSPDCMHFSFFWRFSIGCGSKFRAEVAYLEVGSSDLEPIHEKHVFR